MFKAFKTTLDSFTERYRSAKPPKKQPVEQIDDAESDSAEVAEESHSRLYRCDACDTVYLAMYKTVCSECNRPVEQVPSTLSTK